MSREIYRDYFIKLVNESMDYKEDSQKDLQNILFASEKELDIRFGTEGAPIMKQMRRIFIGNRKFGESECQK